MRILEATMCDHTQVPRQNSIISRCGDILQRRDNHRWKAETLSFQMTPRSLSEAFTTPRSGLVLSWRLNNPKTTYCRKQKPSLAGAVIIRLQPFLTHTHIHTYTHTHTHTHTHTNTYTYTQTQTHTPKHTHQHTYTKTHPHTPTHTHTQPHPYTTHLPQPTRP